MKKYLCIAALFGSALLAGCSHPQAAPPPPPPVLDYQAIQQQGNHDGYDAARRDVETGQPPIFNHHPRYRNPPVPRPGWQAYRTGFRLGYNDFLHHAPPPAPTPGSPPA
jgi:hypothetical protein